MRRYDNYDATKAITGDFETLQPGGYICVIKNVRCEEKPYGELMTIEFDIAEGDKKGFYQKKFMESTDRVGIMNSKWQGKLYQTIKPDDLRFFKGFMTSIENSNQGFKWDWDEKKLEGKLFGGVFDEEEYRNDKGEVKAIVKCRQVRTVQSIREGKYKLPGIKKLPDSQGPAVFNIDVTNTDDCPF